MTKRLLPLFLILTACSTATTVPSSSPVVPVPTQSVAPTPPSGASGSAPVVASRPVLTFEEWRAQFLKRAEAQGFDRAFLDAQFATVRPSERVVTLDGKQPEFSRPISAYVRGAVSSARISTAQTRLPLVAGITETEARSGVPRAILGAIWAMESDFGRVQGDFDILSAFATLAHDGRRRDWAETQLLYSLRILRDRGIPRERLKGSWAGAMGQTQFLPENYLKLGMDGDGNGVVDIWTSDADALASAANLLATSGWRRDQAWAVEVRLPVGFDYYLSETEKQTPGWWVEKGVVRADGGTFNASELAEQAVLILPSGAQGPAFLALPNHFVIRRYNNSTAYALAVGLLADGIAGKPALVTPWPEEVPLSLEQRQAAQRALNSLGFKAGAVDGVIGAGTRAAIRNWQRARSLPADGYLSPGMVVLLESEMKARPLS